MNSKLTRLLAASAAAATLALGLGVAPASAGGDPNGSGPAPIVAPAGFQPYFEAQNRFVVATCNLDPQTNSFTVRVYNTFKPYLDAALAATGNQPSPSYFEWANSDANNGCPKG